MPLFRDPPEKRKNRNSFPAFEMQLKKYLAISQSRPICPIIFSQWNFTLIIQFERTVFSRRRRIRFVFILHINSDASEQFRKFVQAPIFEIKLLNKFLIHGPIRCQSLMSISKNDFGLLILIII